MIACVRQGDKYGPEYVTALRRMCAEVYPGEAFVCLSDRENDCEVRPIRGGLAGWWSKIELFSPGNADLRPLLYFDLDTIVREPLSPSVGFRMVRDFCTAKMFNSSVMWVPEDVDGIWARFNDDVIEQNRKWGDQAYLSRFCSEVWEHEEVKSYREHRLKKPEGAVICFHGKPKPHEAGGWAEEHWRRYAT